LRERAPARLERLEVRMTRFEEALKQAGMDTKNLTAPSSKRQVLTHLLTRCILFLVLLGPATFGTLIHYPAYRIGGFLATRLYNDTEDVVSTIKIISAMLLFPLTWIVLTVITFKLAGWPLALLALVLMPVVGYVAIRFAEELDSFFGGLRALVFFLRKRRFFVRLIAERNAIRNEILALGDEVALATP
jgi:ABC-type multidrug transport system fused ATPase/permease subunit